MNSVDYALVLTSDDNGTFLVTCPDLPELTTFGEDEADAFLRAVDALEEALAARISTRQPVPQPKQYADLPTVALPAQTMLKLALYRALQESGTSKAELARRMNAHGPQVDRLLDLHHKSHVESLECALHHLGKRVLIQTAGL